MLSALLEHAAYMPHGYCLFWEPWLVVLFAGSDLLIFGAYSAIPFALFMFLRRRPNFGFGKLVALFGAFILLCGLTHIISILTLWLPVYPLHGLAKLLTGVVSAATAVALFRIAPIIAKLPGPSELQAANDRLTAEVAAHEATLEELRAAKTELERRVDERTAELAASNERLRTITDETIHRSRNLLMVVRSIARQTKMESENVETFFDSLSGRLQALASATAKVRVGEGATTAQLGEVLRDQLSHQVATFGKRLSIEGPDVPVKGEAAQQIALAVHELSTNAVKYGALSGDVGNVRLEWRFDRHGGDKAFELTWREIGEGVAATGGSGFGSILLERLVPRYLSGEGRRGPLKDGLIYSLRAPASGLIGT